MVTGENKKRARVFYARRVGGVWLVRAHGIGGVITLTGPGLSKILNSINQLGGNLSCTG